jgi:hypothetical protein
MSAASTFAQDAAELNRGACGEFGPARLLPFKLTQRGETPLTDRGGGAVPPVNPFGHDEPAENLAALADLPVKPAPRHLAKVP